MPDEVTMKERVIRWGALLLFAMLGAGPSTSATFRSGEEVTWIDLYGRNDWSRDAG